MTKTKKMKKISKISEVYKKRYYNRRKVNWDNWISDLEKRTENQKPLIKLEKLNYQEIAMVLDELKEPSYQEASTTSFIADKMLFYGYELQKRNGKIKQNETELVFTNGNPKLYVRVDLDAVSLGNGKHTHSCGHNVNMASVLEVARKIKESRLRNIGFIFQPAEEGPGNESDGYIHPKGFGGGQSLRAKGVYQKVPALISCHIDTSLEDNEVRITNGQSTAAAYRFTYKANGKIAHAALPWQGENPFEKLINFGINLSQLNKRFKELSVPQYGLVTASQVNTPPGEINSLAPYIEIKGISRLSGENSLKIFNDFMKEHNCKIELEAPPVINDDKLVEIANEVAKENNYKIITNPAKFRDETAWAGPLTKPWVENPEKYTIGCKKILHFFTPNYNPKSGGLHSNSFCPNLEKAVSAQKKMIYGIAEKFIN